MLNKTEKCSLCGEVCEQKYLWSHTDTTQSKYEKENTNYQPQKYDLYLCEECGVEHWNPMKNPGGVWYERDERYANRNVDPTLVPGLQHQIAIKEMKKNLGIILDVGCGNGNFLAYAYKNGFTGEGFDFDRDGIESGKRAFGLESLFVDDLTGYKQKNPNKKFDWVTFFDVFEHIDNHNIFTEDIKYFLKNSGHISLSIPHAPASRWLLTSDLPPRHLTRWSQSAIKQFLERKGFKEIKIFLLRAPFHQIVLKLKWKYGWFFQFGFVGKVKQKQSTETYINKQGKTSFISKKSMKIKLFETVAKMKDYLIFGIPAIAVWLYLFATKKIYTDQIVIARI